MQPLGMATYQLIALSREEHRIWDTVANWSDPLPAAGVYEPTLAAIATTGALATIALAPLHPMTTRDLEVTGAGLTSGEIRVLRTSST
jgi:hypothetical protein